MDQRADDTQSRSNRFCRTHFGRETLVVFGDDSATLPLRWLRKGIRHCFATIRTHDDWLLVDPLKRMLLLDRLALPPGFDLAGHYADRGLTVLRGQTRTGPRALIGLLRPSTCVEIVKRVVGVSASGVFTPYQLYRHLSSDPSSGFIAYQRETANFAIDRSKK
jgi:hypothetical protein